MTDREDGLTHLDADGRARMVDVSGKDVTSRRAVAEGQIVMSPQTLERIVAGGTEKGDPIRIAELAGVMGGKKTSDLIPLCHALPGASIRVRIEPAEELPGLVATAEAIITGQTGV